MTSFLKVSFIPSEQCVLFFLPQSSLLTDLSSVIRLSYQQFLLSISESLASITLRSALDPLGLSSQAKSLHPNAWLFLTLPPGDTFLSLPSSLRLGAPSH